MTWQTTSIGSDDTERLGELLGKHLEGGEVIELRSDLGGGKTTFVRGLVRGLGSYDKVSSPTFTLKNVYKVSKNQPSRQSTAQGADENRKRGVHVGTVNANRSQQRSDVPEVSAESSASVDEQDDAARELEMHHYDFYRLSEPGVVSEQLAESRDGGQIITVVEWSDIVKNVLPVERITIEFEPSKADPDERAITITYPENKRGLITAVETEWKEVRP